MGPGLEREEYPRENGGSDAGNSTPTVENSSDRVRAVLEASWPSGGAAKRVEVSAGGQSPGEVRGG